MKAPWKELVGGRVLIQNSVLTEEHPLLEVIVIEVSPSGQRVKFSMPMGQFWQAHDAFELVEVLPLESDIKVALDCWQICQRLRQGAANSIALLNDNEEGSGPDNCAVELSCEETKFEPKCFYGMSVKHALIAKKLSSLNSIVCS